MPSTMRGAVSEWARERWVVKECGRDVRSRCTRSRRLGCRCFWRGGAFCRRRSRDTTMPCSLGVLAVNFNGV
jgi:hypothetical protein